MNTCDTCGKESPDLVYTLAECPECQKLRMAPPIITDAMVVRWWNSAPIDLVRALSAALNGPAEAAELRRKILEANR